MVCPVPFYQDHPALKLRAKIILILSNRPKVQSAEKKKRMTIEEIHSGSCVGLLMLFEVWVAQASFHASRINKYNLELLVFLPAPPKFWAYRHTRALLLNGQGALSPRRHAVSFSCSAISHWRPGNEGPTSGHSSPPSWTSDLGLQGSSELTLPLRNYGKGESQWDPEKGCWSRMLAASVDRHFWRNAPPTLMAFHPCVSLQIYIYIFIDI